MPLFWVSLAFLVGIILAALITLPAVGWTLAAIIPLLLLVSPIYRRWSGLPHPSLQQFNQSLRIPNPRFYLLILTFISVGAIRYQISQPVLNPAQLAYYNDQPTVYILQGVIVDPPDVRETYTNLRVQIEQISTINDQQSISVRGFLLARVDQATPIRYGDRIRITGKLETPPEAEDFSYRDYLANQSVYSMTSFPKVDVLQHGQGNPIRMVLNTFREDALKAIYRMYPDPEASLIAGIVLGIQRGIPEKVQEAFRLTGTSHIIVISGFNITVIAQLFALSFTWFMGRYKGAALAVIGIILYTLLVGANAAVVRAAIFGLLTIGGRLLGRHQMGVNSLVFAAALMALITPTVLWDISFQLSFAATLGIILYTEPLTGKFKDYAAHWISPERVERLAGPMAAYFLVTLAAQVTTLPLIIYYFKRISLTSLIANPLILPAQPPLMVLGGLSALAGTFSQPIGQILAWATLPFTTFTIRVIEWLATIPHGSIPLGHVALPVIITFYILLFVFSVRSSRLTGLVKRVSPAIPLIALLIVTFLVWKSAFYAPDHMLHVTVLDVGTGEAVFIQSPSGRYVLINGGPSSIRLSDALGRRLPPFHRMLDWLVVADIDNENLSGIASNLDRFTPGGIMWAGNTYGSRASADLWRESMALSIPVTRMQPGMALDLGSSASLKVLFIDARGAVLLLEWDHFSMLLPMGMDFEALDSLQQNLAMRNISALLLAESGYAPLNTPELINNLHPHLAILSVAAADKSGLPSRETLEALESYNLLRTDLNGWIKLTTDGIQMWVEVERP